MSLLEDAIQEQQNLINKGYERQVIMTAAAIVIAKRLESIDKTLQQMERNVERAVTNGLNRGTD